MLRSHLVTGAWPKDVGFGVPSCSCWNSGANYLQFSSHRSVGTDETDGRYATVSVQACRDCGTLWLRYSVEYESFSRSGRWARGPITQEEASEMTPELATAHIERDAFAYGGSYFDGGGGWRTGRMLWGP